MPPLIESTPQEQAIDPLRIAHPCPPHTTMFDTRSITVRQQCHIGKHNSRNTGCSGHDDPYYSRPDINLVFAAQRLREFLSTVHNSENTPRGSLYYPNPILAAAVKRYTGVWLPLVASYGPRGAPQLAAPLDVAWVWHLHRLDPEAYRRDCELAFGFVVPQTGDCPFETASTGQIGKDDNCMPESERLARSEWRKFAPSEPFDIKPSMSLQNGQDVAEELGNGGKILLSFDVEGSAGRQGGFLWQVSDPIYNESSFLQRALERYLMLTRLWQMHTGKTLVPTYDMDLMWHAHMSFPVNYKNDIIRLVGREVAHDDSITDRSPDGDNTRYANQTAALWSQTFPGTSWAERRCMWRGEPPFEYWGQSLTVKLEEQCPVGLPVCEGVELITRVPHQSRKPPSASPYLLPPSQPASSSTQPASGSRASVSQGMTGLASSAGPVQLGEGVYYAMPKFPKNSWFLRYDSSVIKGFVDSKVIPPFGRSADPNILYFKILSQEPLKGGRQVSFELYLQCLPLQHHNYRGCWASCTVPYGLPDNPVYLVCPVDTRCLGLQKRSRWAPISLVILLVVNFAFFVPAFFVFMKENDDGSTYRIEPMGYVLFAMGFALAYGVILLAALWSRGCCCFNPYEPGELQSAGAKSRAATASYAAGCGAGAGCGGDPFQKPTNGGSGCGGGGCGGGCGG